MPDRPDAPLSPQHRAERLLEISLVLNSTRDLNALLQHIIETAAEVLGCEAASLLLYDEEAGRLRFAAATGADPAELARIPVPLDASLAGTIFTENRPLTVQDVADDPRHFKDVGEQVDLATRSLLGVPMRVEQTTTGVLEALNKRGGPFTEADAETLTVLAAQAAIAVRNARQVQALQAAYEQARRFDRLKSDFMALASHELRTPLSAVLGYGALLQEEAPESLREFADAVVEAGERMHDVIELMHGLELLRTGDAVLQRRDAVLQDIVRRAADAVRGLAADRGVALDLALPAAPLRLHADVDRLQTALQHVLRNAVQFTPEGGTVTVTAAATDDAAEVRVRDTGRGVAAEDLERIFDEFVQVEDHLTRTHHGLGLGLTLTRALVRLHGGRVWAESPGLGGGTTVVLHLPRG